MLIMPLTFGIPLGLLVIVIGIVLFLFTRYKKAGWVIMGIGIGITVVMLLLIVLVINSQM
jgi:hypothetical protein